MFHITLVFDEDFATCVSLPNHVKSSGKIFGSLMFMEMHFFVMAVSETRFHAYSLALAELSPFPL